MRNLFRANRFNCLSDVLHEIPKGMVETRLVDSWSVTKIDLYDFSRQLDTIDVVSVVSGGENGGHEGRTSHGRIFT